MAGCCSFLLLPQAAQKEPLQEGYLYNAAVLPDWRAQRSSSPAPDCGSGSGVSGSWVSGATEKPLAINGLGVEEYQSLYHSMVDPLLFTTSGSPRKYTRGLGLRIKAQLRQALHCTGAPLDTLSLPQFIVDVSDEPGYLPPAKTRRRH